MQFLTTVCIAAIAAALFRMLVPENKAEKQIAFLVVCVFLLTCASALTGAEIDLNADVYDIGTSADYIGFSGEVNKSLQKKICKDMSDKLYELMNENGIYPEEIHVIVNISGLYSIDITQVKLVLGEEQRGAATAASELLAEELDEDVEAVIEVR